MMLSNGDRIVLSCHIAALWSPLWGLISDIPLGGVLVDRRPGAMVYLLRPDI